MEGRDKIAIFGAGTMGAGMAVQYALHGHEVILWSRTRETLERAGRTVRKSCGLLESAGAEQAAARITYTTEVEEAAAQAWYVVETIAERADAKIALYERLDALLPEEVILSSNTSYMDIFQLLPTRRQSRAIIAHWFAPAHILPLVEIIKGPETRQDVVERMMDLHRACGKTPICMDRYVPGFIINRLQSAMTREVLFLLENGYCTAEDIDLAVKTSLMPRGLALGVVQRMDFNGLDVVAGGLRNGKYSPAPAPGEDNLILRYANEGRLGVKSGVGLYDYTHLPYEQVLNTRDEQLLKSVALAEEFIAQPLYRK